jgi:hypothetical protein
MRSGWAHCTQLRLPHLTCQCASSTPRPWCLLEGANQGAASFSFTGVSSVAPVPEPSSLAITGIGALGIIGYRLRRSEMSARS